MGEAFDVATDDLCEWFEPADVAAIVVAEYSQLGRTITLGDPAAVDASRWAGDRGEAGCEWMLGNDIWVAAVGIHPEFVAEVGPETLGFQPFSEHPSLDDGVTWTHAGFGTMLIHVENTMSMISFSHGSPEAGAGGSDPTEELRVANAILRGMNWLPAP